MLVGVCMMVSSLASSLSLSFSLRVRNRSRGLPTAQTISRSANHITHTINHLLHTKVMAYYGPRQALLEASRRAMTAGRHP